MNLKTSLDKAKFVFGPKVTEEVEKASEALTKVILGNSDSLQVVFVLANFLAEYMDGVMQDPKSLTGQERIKMGALVAVEMVAMQLAEQAVLKGEFLPEEIIDSSKENLENVLKKRGVVPPKKGLN